MIYQMEDLTLDDIRRASSNYLRSCLKEDIAPELSDMIDKELYRYLLPIYIMIGGIQFINNYKKIDLKFENYLN